MIGGYSKIDVIRTVANKKDPEHLLLIFRNVRSLKMKNTRRLAAGLFAFFVLLCADHTFSRDTRLDLSGGWVIKIGDDHAWAQPDFDDSDWQSIQTAGAWESGGMAGYDGFAWYRVKFTVPESWREKARHGFLGLFLGRIDDVDFTYFNGEQIGTTGSLPPDYRTAFYADRTYRVPSKLIKWGGANVIAVRVYDRQGEGGLYQGKPVLSLPGPADYLDLQFKPKTHDGIFFPPAPIAVSLELNNYSKSVYNSIAGCTLTTDRIDSVGIVEEKQVIFNVAGNKSKTKAVEFVPPKPGFYRLIVTLQDNLQYSMVLGYDVENIDTPLTRPDDFAGFWQQRKKGLAGVQPEYRVTKSDRSTGELDVFLVEMRSYGNVRIRGWYTVPRKNGPFAAILSVPGYGGDMRPNFDRTHVATLALNIRGHGNSKEDLDPGDREYMFIDFDPRRPEDYIYTGAFMDCLRGIDFLASRPEIDATRIGVEGGSQGGGLSFATAALDDRVCFCAPDIPWLGDWAGYQMTAHWPRENYDKLLKSFPGLTADDILAFLSYFDTMNMAEWISCPVLMSVGLQDNVCPPRISFSPYNNVQTEKEYRVYPFAGHSTRHQHGKYKNSWMARMLGVEGTGL